MVIFSLYNNSINSKDIFLILKKIYIRNTKATDIQKNDGKTSKKGKLI